MSAVPMRILLGTDGSEAAAAARELLKALPLPSGSRIHVVCAVSEPIPLIGPYADGFWVGQETYDRLSRTERDLALEAVDSAAADLSGTGLEVTTAVVEGSAAAQIVALADEIEADLIVLGSRGLSGLDRLILGSVARNVAKHSRRPVLVARAPEYDLKNGVICTDGSPNAAHALAFTAGLPLPEDLTLTAAHVIRPYSPFPGLFPTDQIDFEEMVTSVQARQKEAGEDLLARAAEQLTAAGKSVQTELLTGDPATELLSLVDDLGADLVIVGARGSSLMGNLLVGSVADRILKSAPCSVLIVH